MTQQVLVMTSVDTEEEWDWDGPFPESGASVDNVLRLPVFQDLCASYGMRTTYFANLPVIEHPSSRRVIQGLAQREDVEVGMHIHPWHTPPLVPFRGSAAMASFLHNHPPEVARAKLEAVHAAFRSAGIVPTSFRGGRYSSGGAIHAFLHERGFVADCSVVPYTTWPDDGAPDFRERGLFPTRVPPPRENLKPLWEIPLSLGFSRRPFRLWARCFDLVERSALRRLRLIGLAERLGLLRKVWLNFELADPHDWTPFLKLVQRMGVPSVCLTVHSSSLTTGPGPYTRTPEDEKRIFGQIEKVFADIRRLPGFVPATASEVAGHLERRYAGSGN